MHDDAQRVVEYRFVARIFPAGRTRSCFDAVDQGMVTMRFVQGVQECTRQIAMRVEMIEQSAQEKVVQDNDTRMTRQHREHVLVQRGVADMVNNAFVLFRMFFKPVRRTNRQRGVDPRIIDRRLIDDHVDVIVHCQLRQQFRTVVGNAGLFRRQWGHIRQPRTRSLGRHHDACFIAASCMQMFKCFQSTLCARIPGKQASLLQSVFPQAGQVSIVG